MYEFKFTTEDFDSLSFVYKFNKEHWKGGNVGWNYDVNIKNTHIKKIQESLWLIKEKLEILRRIFAEKKEYKGLISGVQKINLGITNEYLDHLWIHFVKGLEERHVNEPQLQFSIHKDDIQIELWFDNNIATEKYLKPLILKHSDLLNDILKKNPLICIEVYKPEMNGNLIDEYSYNEFQTFKKQVIGLRFDCRVGFSFYVNKKDVIKQQEKIILILEGYFNKIKPLFDISVGALVGSYKAHHSLFNGEEREFRGFCMVEQWDTEKYSPVNTVKKYWTKREIIASKSDISLRHQLIQDKIFDLLVEKYGKKAVRTEMKTGFGSKVDIVVHPHSEYFYYEIKTIPDLKYCFREALGQLLEYSYWPKSTEADKLIVISEESITETAKKYLNFLREYKHIPIYYQRFDIGNVKLSELY